MNNPIIANISALCTIVSLIVFLVASHTPNNLEIADTTSSAAVNSTPIEDQTGTGTQEDLGVSLMGRDPKPTLAESIQDLVEYYQRQIHYKDDAASKMTGILYWSIKASGSDKITVPKYAPDATISIRDNGEDYDISIAQFSPIELK